jgi:hypothetical protein
MQEDDKSLESRTGGIASEKVVPPLDRRIEIYVVAGTPLFRNRLFCTQVQSHLTSDPVHATLSVDYKIGDDLPTGLVNAVNLAVTQNRPLVLHLSDLDHYCQFTGTQIPLLNHLRKELGCYGALICVRGKQADPYGNH